MDAKFLESVRASFPADVPGVTLGAPVLDAWQPYYVNFPRRHPLYGGIVAEEMPDALSQADVVFLVEAVAPWHPPSAAPRDGARVLVLGVARRDGTIVAAELYPVAEACARSPENRRPSCVVYGMRRSSRNSSTSFALSGKSCSSISAYGPAVPLRTGPVR